MMAVIRLGGDTDTIGSIVGGIAGIMYGLDGAASKWMSDLKGRDYLEDIIKQFEELLGVYE